MSFTEKKFVAIHCDECDEQYDPEDGSAYYTDKDDADDDASSDGWQLDGDENHYCPQHWHLTCSKCGKTAMGNLDILPRMNAGDSRISRFGFLFDTTKQEGRGR